MKQIVFPYYFFSTKGVRKGEAPGGSGWVCAGAGHGDAGEAVSFLLSLCKPGLKPALPFPR